ncbi:hypothetical protein [Actinopolyspora halophila]|uniref:hypothetical protein n=1 Tax=Actinopolyspora halophila TaxID=1850 RepID=UPI0003751A77|nr:hypothetical protein [Actinopolyspora halophila]
MQDQHGVVVVALVEGELAAAGQGAVEIAPLAVQPGQGVAVGQHSEVAPVGGDHPLRIVRVQPGGLGGARVILVQQVPQHGLVIALGRWAGFGKDHGLPLGEQCSEERGFACPGHPVEDQHVTAPPRRAGSPAAAGPGR